MNVICQHTEICNNFDCRHKNEHPHYSMCDEDCTKHDHWGAKCVMTIIEERKQKLKKLKKI